MNHPTRTTLHFFAFITFSASPVLLSMNARADVIFTIASPSADAFLATGSPGNPVGTDLTGLNFGGAGTLAIAPAGSAKGQMDSLLRFNFAGAVSQFNSTYGAGNWQINGVTLRLASNFGVGGVQPGNMIFNVINGGSFGIDWLGYDGWVEGGGGGMGGPGFPTTNNVSFNSIPSLYASGSANLGDFTYAPPGNNVYVSYTLPLNASLIADASNGGDVSLYFYAADNQVGYLFNARSFGANAPQLVISATAVPEPAAFGLIAIAFVGNLISRKRLHRS